MSRILTLPLTAATTLWAVLPAAAQPAPAGVVEQVQGNALAVNDAVPRVLVAGDAVHVGDVLSTGPASRLEIRLSDDGIFVLGETAAFVIVDYTFGQAGENNLLLRVIQGAFVATSGALGPQVAEARMRSRPRPRPSASAGRRYGAGRSTMRSRSSSSKAPASWSKAEGRGSS